MDAIIPNDNLILQEMGKRSNKEYFLLLQDINLIENLLTYDYTYFAMVYPSVTKHKYKTLKEIVQGKHPKLNILFVKYRYHNYKNNSDGYVGLLNNKSYEKLDKDLPIVAWKTDSREFKKFMVIYMFKGRKFDSCELVTHLEDEKNMASDICLARKNVIFDKNFSQ